MAQRSDWTVLLAIGNKSQTRASGPFATLASRQPQGKSWSLLSLLIVGLAACKDPGAGSESDDDPATSNDDTSGDDDDDDVTDNKDSGNTGDDDDGDDDSDDDDDDDDDGTGSTDSSSSAGDDDDDDDNDDDNDDNDDNDSTSSDASDSGDDDDDDDDDDDGSWPTDPVAPSVDPPGGLTPAQAPMFVSLGFDDNAYCDSMHWFADFVRDKKNADGSKVRATFFITAGYAEEKLITEGGQTKDDVLDTWSMLYDDGHEIANHTWSHDHGRGKDAAWWTDQIGRAQDLFANQLGVPRHRLRGFRTPFLEYDANTFEALRGLTMGYDCSVEFGYDWWQHDPNEGGHGSADPKTGEWYYWPYTLDNGTPMGSADAGAGINPGMWEVPVYTYNQLQGEMVRTITGFDFNMWKTLPTDAQFLEVLKYSFDQRYRGNRSPFTVNAHTDYYSQYNPSDDPEFGCKDYLLRRKAMEEFLDYVLTFKEVRVVPFVDVIKWMRNPVAWDKMSIAPARGQDSANR